MDLEAVSAELATEPHSLKSESALAVHAVPNIRIDNLNLLFGWLIIGLHLWWN